MNDLKRVLVVYEVVPEETQLFDITMSTDDFEKFSTLTGKFGGLAGNSETVDDLVNVFSEKLSSEWAGSQKELTEAQKINGKFDGVIITGFML